MPETSRTEKMLNQALRALENYAKALNALAQENMWTTQSKNAMKAIREKYNWTKV